MAGNTHRVLDEWIQSVAEVTAPERVVVCNGTEEECRSLERTMIADGTFIGLNPVEFPHCYLHRSHPSDVARTEQLTFICSEAKEDAGPTNNWMSPSEARERVWPLFRDAMSGRTMYVVPYLMGPEASPYSRVGVELTDSPYVVANLRVMTRMGDVAMARLLGRGDFVRGIHSLGDLSPERRFICHFPELRTVWSIGSGYGGNALLAKKCHALRLASVEARDEGWLAEHMLIVGITDPDGRTAYIAAAFPSGCGKTNLAMLIPTLPGYRVETVGDDIAWMHVGQDGRLWAINPEAGMFGIAPGTNDKTNPNAMRALGRDAIFTNVGLTPDGKPWWEGLSDAPPPGTLDWRGSSEHRGPCAHPNARYTVAAKQCPSVGSTIEAPEGVPISAIVFGGRRKTASPLVYEARSFEHGVYVGATMVSETTAAAVGAAGVPRHDPMAMLPFCGYNMADYFRHWLEVGGQLLDPPRIYHVNWFRTDAAGRMLWPGYGENIRVLQWMIDRALGSAGARSTFLGLMPLPNELNLGGLSLSEREVEALFALDGDVWLEEAARHREFLSRFGDRMPEALWEENAGLVSRIEAARRGARRAAM